MIIEQIIEWGKDNPKRLFQIDGVGAIFSAMLLGIVLVKLQGLFGIPKSTLYFLASLPCLFAIYDFYCYFQIDKNLGIFLKGIAFSNLIYCSLSIGLAIYHKEVITNLGWIYIVSEIVLIGILAIIELRVAKKQIESKLK
ncbi:hypothetical protein U6A24_09790 [Aquimarina gracilis]|uniref:Uncharacterized protein n=1 Tax=Aquimarina gracilis TaxID=874422 RepID=A0ABU5ZVC6_9FLAO|nr:hypothetical protein [Aquimarina gracilis]MEB3345753.1 hypothetical protein [Aquimarina gracilis]